MLSIVSGDNPFLAPRRIRNSENNLLSIPIYETIILVEIKRTPEFKKWFEEQTEKSQAQIDARLKNIEMFDYFGDHKALGNKLLELRWKNGRRVYYSLVVSDSLTLILLGGIKNAQQKDIQKARKILERESSG